jgi:hypothetical protein
VATTSPKPRYALQRAFADLLSPALEGEDLEREIESWKQQHLSSAALGRLALLRRGVAEDSEAVIVHLPNGESRRLAAGPSAVLTKDVVEQMAPRFLAQPAAVLISESARKIGYEDRELLGVLGLEIDASRALPDLVLVDLDGDDARLVFVECVITDGPIDQRRKQELEELAAASGFEDERIFYITAFSDRADRVFRSVAATLAWGTFAWFASEPDCLVHWRGSDSKKVLSELGPPAPR